MIADYSIYEVINGEKHRVLSAPTKEEAEHIFKLTQLANLYRNKAYIEWQSTFFDNEPMMGFIVK